MRKRMAVLVATIVAVIALAVPAIGLVVDGTTNATQLVATLTGGGEVPAIQTATSGLARVTIDVDKRLICYELSVTGKLPVAAHIHQGAADANGGIVVDFGAFGQKVDRNTEGCTRKMPKSAIKAIAENPAGYYVNVHSARNPGGEVRGQLSG